jgi:membrane protein required for colicin V production
VNWLDAVIVAVILWFTWAAFQAGFIREIVTITAAILGVVLAGLFYQELADDVLLFIDSGTVARIVAFGLIFSAVALAGQMLALVLKPTAHLLQLGMFDQIAGGLFGFAKAMVFIQIFLILFVTYPKWGMDETIDNSAFGSLIVENTAVLVHILPDEFEARVDDFSGGVNIPLD